MSSLYLSLISSQRFSFNSFIWISSLFRAILTKSRRYSNYFINCCEIRRNWFAFYLTPFSLKINTGIKVKMEFESEVLVSERLNWFCQCRWRYLHFFADCSEKKISFIVSNHEFHITDLISQKSMNNSFNVSWISKKEVLLLK